MFVSDNLGLSPGDSACFEGARVPFRLFREPIAVVDRCSGRRIVDGARRFRGKCKGHKIEPHSRSVDCGIHTGNELRQAEEAHR
jgi:hypothetical protein